ncbi:MAG TPA: dihydroxyacetone kinase subunit DhaL [Bryobacteraceae bacterium]|nr:dihydroxyacetone kinase subunit DhaL [Bryobacteraceae bacterium]
MSAKIGTEQLAYMFRGAADRVREQHRRLSDLDCVAGDGDHGSTMLRVVEQLELAAAGSHSGPRALLRDAGWKVMGVDGGASSSLLGTFFTGMGDVPGTDDALDCPGLAAAFEYGLAAVRRQTKAQPGDKTMIDALVPAVGALRESADAGAPVADALRRAAESAESGAASTKDLVAKHGRAKYLGAKTLGHEDPGAVSLALLFDGFCAGLKESKGETGNAGRG